MDKKVINDYTRNIIIGIIIAIIAQGFYDSLNIFYGGVHEKWFLPIETSGFIVLCIIFAMCLIWIIWGRNKRLH